MIKGKNRTAEALHALRTTNRVINISIDNYIEKELLGNLYNATSKHLDSRIDNLAKLVNAMPSANSEYRENTVKRLEYEIRREVNYGNNVRALSKVAIPTTKDFSLVLYWVKQSRRVINEAIPSYNNTFSRAYQRIYNSTKNNRLKTELNVQCKIMQDKFYVILSLLQKDIYGRYITEIENLLATARTYVKCYDGIKDVDKTETLDLVNNIQNEFKTISDYKYLNKLAEDNNFIKVGQSGSHAQFKHSDGRLVTIPQGRDIGKGLSIKIQKDIETDRLTKRLNLIGG